MTNHCLFVMFTFVTLTVDDAFQDHMDEETHFKSFGKYDHEATEENMTNIIATDNGPLNFTMKPGVTCDDARIKCALRQGCGTALQSYMLDCADIMHGRTTQCDEFCKASLIALTSTEEGESLVNCLCTDEFCKQSKERLEVCRKEVILANAHNAVVSCNVAHLICSADTSCSTALYYYDKLCRRMFSGRTCTLHCNNSISILGRQKKAEKLSNCVCDGTESFACERIKTNMVTLCFNQKDEKIVQKNEEESNEVDTANTNLKNGCCNIVFFSLVQNYILGIYFGILIFLRENWSNWLLGNTNTKTFLVLFGLTLSIVVRWEIKL